MSKTLIIRFLIGVPLASLGFYIMEKQPWQVGPIEMKILGTVFAYSLVCAGLVQLPITKFKLRLVFILLFIIAGIITCTSTILTSGPGNDGESHFWSIFVAPVTGALYLLLLSETFFEYIFKSKKAEQEAAIEEVIKTTYISQDNSEEEDLV